MNGFSIDSLLASSDWSELIYTIAILAFAAITGLAEHFKKKAAKKHTEDLTEATPTFEPEKSAPSSPPQSPTMQSQTPAILRPLQQSKTQSQTVLSGPQPISKPMVITSRRKPVQSGRAFGILPDSTAAPTTSPPHTESSVPQRITPASQPQTSHPLPAAKYRHAFTPRNLKQFILIREILDQPLALRKPSEGQ